MKEKWGLILLENIIYHAVILMFIIALVVYLLFLQKKVHELKTSIIPFFLEKRFEFPAQKSLFIRGIRALEQLLSEKFGARVCLEYDKSRQVFWSDEFKFFADILFNEKHFHSFYKTLGCVDLTSENFCPHNLKLKQKRAHMRFVQITKTKKEVGHIICENEFSAWKFFE